MRSTLPAARSIERVGLLGLRAEAAHHVDADGEAREALLQRLLVLERQHGGRREEGDLFAVHRRLERGAHRHFGLAVADVAAQQAVHRRRRFHVLLDVGDRGRLIDGQVVFEGVLELLLPVRIGREGVARHRLARGVELEQLLGHVAHGFLDFALGLLPRGAAEPIDRRLRRAGVLLDQIEPLDRHEQLVLARVAELEEFLHAVADADLLEADEHADAIVDVHDVVADLEVAQIRQEGLGRRAAALGSSALLLEDVRLGVDLEAGVGEAESARQRANRDEHGGIVRVLGALHRNREDVVLLQHFDRTLGAARRRRHEQHRLPIIAKTPDLGHPVGDAPFELDRRLRSDLARAGVQAENGQLRRLRQARGDGVPVREQLVRTRQVRGSSAGDVFVALLNLIEQLGRVRVDLVALGDDDARGAGPRQVVEDRGIAIVLQDVAKGNDRNLIDRRNRSLRRRIVGAERLDRVPDELQPYRVRFAGGKDVGDAAADGEFPRFVGRVFAREAGVDQQLGEIDRRDVLSRLQGQRRRKHAVGGGDAREHAGGGGDHHTSGALRDRVQGARPHRRDADVGRQAAIRIDFVRRKGQDRALNRCRRQSFQRREEKRHVRAGFLEIAVARHDVEHDAFGLRVGGRGHEQGFGGRGQTGHASRRGVHAAAGDGGLQDGAKVQRC